MSQPAADRNLLFGILAMQMDFISRDALIKAMNAWVLEKAKPLGQIILEQGALREDAHALLEALVSKHLEMHGNDPEKSLASVSSIGSVREELQLLADPDVQASLVHVSAARPMEADPYATKPPSVGTPTSSGLRFRILRPHAKGGLGQVSVALDEELHRVVALKEIQDQHADHPHSRNRFVLEAEITGGLEHPGIVPVYGLGHSADGRPFYAMRFIKGDSLQGAIRQFHQAEGAGRDPGERSLQFRKLLGRFVDVCEAVAYAHSRGVLHRDLKPDNIMLGKYGQTLVVDWGLAKPLDRPEDSADPDERPLRPASVSGSAPTQLGTAIGTPQYMSPEQAAGRLEELGVGTDVYSLGATLYCLLTGQAPFQGTDLGTILQQVQRGEFPRPRELNRQLPVAALEAICLKAMALKPEERYPTALALAAEVEHWLADEPVSAYREPLEHRLRRWGRRHRAWVAAAVALLMTTMVALGVSTYLISRQQKKTEEAWREATQQQGRAKANLNLARQAVDKTVTRVAEEERLKRADFHQLRRDLLASMVPFYEEFVRQREVDAELEAQRGRAYYRLAYVRAEIGEKQQAVEAYEQMGAIFARLAADFPDVPEYRKDLATSHNGLALELGNLGKWAEAESANRAALSIQKRLVADFPDVPEYRRELANSHNNLGLLLSDLGKVVEAEASYRAAIAIRERLATDFPAVPLHRRNLAGSQNNLGNLLSKLGKGGEAEAAYRAALDIQERLVADFPTAPDYRVYLARHHNNLGVLLADLGKLAEAEAAHCAALAIKERLVADFPAVPQHRLELASSQNNLGIVLSKLGKRAEAEAAYRAALGIQERLAADFPAMPEYRERLAGMHNNLGSVLKNLGKVAEAEAAYRAAIAIRERLVADFPTAPDYAMNLSGSYANFGNLLRDNGQAQASLDWYAKSITTLEPGLHSEQHLVKARQFLRNSHWGRATALTRLGCHAEALGDWDRTLELDSGLDSYQLNIARAITLTQLRNQGRAATQGQDGAQADGVTYSTPYEVACLYAKASAMVRKGTSLPQADRDQLAERHAGRAVELLAKAQGAGFFKGQANVEHMKKDPDLDPLRNREDFKKLVAELEKAVAK
jgi:serine/threonine protein kinase